jgi:hypothetical protein
LDADQLRAEGAEQPYLGLLGDLLPTEQELPLEGIIEWVLVLHLQAHLLTQRHPQRLADAAHRGDLDVEGHLQLARGQVCDLSLVDEQWGVEWACIPDPLDEHLERQPLPRLQIEHVDGAALVTADGCEVDLRTAAVASHDTDKVFRAGWPLSRSRGPCSSHI